MACHLSACGCITEEGDFPCAVEDASSWCPNSYLVLTEWCQVRKSNCNVCDGTWCGNNPELCTPTTSPVVLTIAPSNFPTATTVEPTSMPFITVAPSISLTLTSAPTISPTLTSAPSIVPTNGPSTLVTVDGSDLTSSLSVWLIIGLTVGAGILIGLICSLFFCWCGRSKSEKSRNINIQALNIVGNEPAGRAPGDVRPMPGEPEIIPEGREKFFGYPGIGSATTIELDPGSPETKSTDRGQNICGEGAVLSQRTTSVSIIRRSRLEGECSMSIPIIMPNNSTSLGAYPANDRVETYQLNMRSPIGENNVVEKDTLPLEHLQRLEVNPKVESPSMSANDFPDLPSPNWDRTEISFQSGSRLKGMTGEPTEAALQSGTDMNAPSAKRKTLAGDEGVDPDEKSVSEIECNTAPTQDTRWISQERVD